MSEPWKIAEDQRRALNEAYWNEPHAGREGMAVMVQLAVRLGIVVPCDLREQSGSHPNDAIKAREPLTDEMIEAEALRLFPEFLPNGEVAFLTDERRAGIRMAKHARDFYEAQGGES